MSPRSYRITVRGRTYEVTVGDLSSSPVTVMVDGVEYQVDLPDAAPRPVASQRPPAPAPPPQPAPARPPAQSPPPRPAAPPRPSVPTAGGSGIARAVMPGRVVAVNVSVGDAVEAGQPLMVVESMKMELTIAAPSSGTVKAVHVQAGDSVQQGQTLVELG